MPNPRPSSAENAGERKWIVYSRVTEMKKSTMNEIKDRKKAESGRKIDEETKRKAGIPAPGEPRFYGDEGDKFLSFEEFDAKYGTDEEFEPVSNDYMGLIEQYYLALACYPDEVSRPFLENIACKLERRDAIVLEAGRYMDDFADEDLELHKRYTSGYAQCIGNLVSDGHRITVVCCKKMATAVVYGHAHMHNGEFYINDREDDYAFDQNGVMSAIKGDEPARAMKKCPFCGAALNIVPPILVEKFREIAGNSE